MDSISSQKKSLAALLAEKRAHRRVVLIYGRDNHTDGPGQRYLLDQQEQFTRYESGMNERDIDVIVLAASTLMVPDRQFLMASPYRLNPAHDFQGWLIGKDGGIKDQFDKPISPPDLFTQIDGMPMRKQEMKRN